MINEIRAAFKRTLDRLAWMDDDTKRAAKEKVALARSLARPPARTRSRRADVCAVDAVVRQIPSTT